jgi:putative FmdB family regulatory protein
MPLYEYRCNDCGTEFEMMMRFSEADRRPECPACESRKTQKKLSAVASFGSGSPDTGGGSCSPRGGFS